MTEEECSTLSISYELRDHIFFFFERLFSKERGLFEVYSYCETLFISRREKLKWRISCFLIDVENIF